MIKGDDKTRVYHITIKATGESRYFASLAALYSVYDSNEIYIAYQSLKNYWQKHNDQPYENAKCIIVKGRLERNKK